MCILQVGLTEFTRVYLVLNIFIDLFSYLPVILNLYLEQLLRVITLFFYCILYLTWEYKQVVLKIPV